MTGKRRIGFPALNVREPWGRLIIARKKVIETRNYPVPDKYLNRHIVLVETPAKRGSFKSKALGLIKIGGQKQYRSCESFLKDYRFHLVDKASEFFWSPKRELKWGWLIDEVIECEQELQPNVRLGRVYTAEVLIYVSDQFRAKDKQGRQDLEA